MKLICWNIGQRLEAWEQLAKSDAAIGLVQEAIKPPSDLFTSDQFDQQPWVTAAIGNTKPWRTAVVKLVDHVSLRWIRPVPIAIAAKGDFAVSQLGTISAAELFLPDKDPIILISVYGAWQHIHSEVGNNWIMADSSVHRIISYISCLIGSQTKHRIIVAGDLNILYGYGEHGSRYWHRRYQGIFDRLDSLGLKFIGSQAPDGRQAIPWPKELPPHSKNVPTYYHTRQDPFTATRQLDHIFASNGIISKIKVRALNDPLDWGPIDHCRIEISFDIDNI